MISFLSQNERFLVCRELDCDMVLGVHTIAFYLYIPDLILFLSRKWQKNALYLIKLCARMRTRGSLKKQGR